MAQTDNVSPRHFMLPPNYDNLSFATTYNKKAELNRLNYIRVILYDQKNGAYLIVSQVAALCYAPLTYGAD